MDHYIRPASESDIPAIKAIADANKQALGFVRLPALKEAQAKGGLIVAKAGDEIVGFARIHCRRDGWITLHEICVDAKYRGGGWGEGLLNCLLAYGSLIRCKVPFDGPVSFYTSHGFEVTGRETGKKRAVLICEYRPDPV